ncbi:MAG: metal-dependent hydrolase [Terrimesophilobacter sp.]
MAFPSADTVVTYPAGDLSGTATVLYSEKADDSLTAVLLDATPCHPVDAAWPDQGPDLAMLTWPGGSSAVRDCVVGATDGAALYLGKDIPVRRDIASSGTTGWTFVVAHLVTEAPAAGQRVTVSVDPRHRSALSLGHTGCHLAALALNLAMADRWTKELPLDGLGTPNFDAAAIASSRILPRGSVDTYRLNKSLRRKGFVTDGLPEALSALQETLNACLTSWIATDAPVRIDRDGDRLTDRRSWVCTLPEGEVSIPCGGTHASALTQLGALRAALTLSDDSGTAVLTMTTGVVS